MSEIEQINETDQTMHPEQKRIFQSMTPEQKLKLALKLYKSAWETKQAVLKNLYPEWPEERIIEKVREIFLYART